MVQINIKVCDGCGTCVGMCPTLALQLTPRLVVDEKLCESCGVCVDICPVAALKLSKE